MNVALKSKIIEDVEKTGFYSEMKVVNKFLNYKCDCDVSVGYFDKDENKSREIDLSASLLNSKKDILSEKEILTGIHFLIEIKKNEHPWIVFKANDQKWWKTMDSQTICNIINLKIKENDLRNLLSKNTLISKLDWIGYGIHECFKKPDSHSRWYSSFVSVVKACEDIGRRKWLIPNTINKSLIIVKPVVILDGEIVLAELTKENKLKISEIPYCIIDFYYKSDNYTREKYRIELVSLKALEDYLSLYQKFGDALNNFVCFADNKSPT
jgi:hypothetical protein